MFGQKLTQLRREKGVQQKGLAIMLCVDQSFVSRIERGRKPPPRPREFIQKVADALALSNEEVAELHRSVAADQILGAAAEGASPAQVGLALSLIKNLKRLRPGEIQAIQAIISLQELEHHQHMEVSMNF